MEMFEVCRNRLASVHVRGLFLSPRNPSTHPLNPHPPPGTPLMSLFVRLFHDHCVKPVLEYCKGSDPPFKQERASLSSV